MRHIGIIGSTGSIGTQTLDIVRSNDDLKVEILSCAGNNLDMFEAQVREFLPKKVCVWQETAAKDFADRVKDLSVKVVSGMDGLIEVSTYENMEILVTAVVGMIGIRPTIEAIKAGKDIALANKETLVTAGHIIMPFAKEYGVRILPVDSEHSAVFQSLNGENPKTIEKLYITASGGPFRGMTLEEMKNKKPSDALKHPNWAMGKKITIDSATMVNKGLEVMEAKWLFDVDVDRIEVVVQPQSIIHSMVGFTDGSIIAQLGLPDMKLPIQYALYYPDRVQMVSRRLDFPSLARITFEAPDLDNFKGLALAYKAIEKGGSMPTVFNAANEWAVAKFLDERIGFTEIADRIEEAMDMHKVIANPNVQDILDTEKWVGEYLDRTV
ncbi:MAG: 1-deoxy-D-xylulose-5-phosphate reductoisomerase [Lachnospiraceae bacterium]|nr:1-deoxy-D-xylulose-5-phosphate reductoisomerase [Lachnospiraceae bacterium]